MIYAKQITDGKLTALLTYEYEPEFGEDSDTVIITEEEYNTLLEELKAAQPAPDPDAITDSEALRIIGSIIIKRKSRFRQNINRR